MVWPAPGVRFNIQLPNDAAGSFTLMEDSVRRPNGITLKRGFLMRDSELYRWCRAGGHDARTLRIHLVNDSGVETTFMDAGERDSHRLRCDRRWYGPRGRGDDRILRRLDDAEPLEVPSLRVASAYAEELVKEVGGFELALSWPERAVAGAI